MFKRGWGVLLVAFAVLCVVVAAGCGDSGEDEALTKSEFVKQGNAICKAGQKERDEVLEAGLRELEESSGNAQAKQAELVEEALPSYENAAEELQDLAAPPGMTDQLDALVAAMEDAAEQVRANPQTAAVSLIQFKDADAKAKALKLDSCIG